MHSQLKKWIGAAFAVSALAVLSQGVQAQETKWDFPCEYGESSMVGIAAKLLAEKVKEKTDGTFIITNHFSGGLGYKSLDHWDAVETGAVPMANSYGGVFSGIDPIFIAPALPFVSKSAAEAKQFALAATPYMDEAFATAGQRVLIAVPWPSGAMWSSIELSSVDDLEKVKIRTSDVMITEVLKNAGANPVQISWADTVPALSTNAINAVASSADGGLSANFADHMSHFYNLKIDFAFQLFHLNIDALEKLPEAHKVALEEAARETQDEMWDLLTERDAEVLDKLREIGVNVYDSDDPVTQELVAHFRTSANSVIENWKQEVGPDRANAFLTDFQGRIEKINN